MAELRERQRSDPVAEHDVLRDGGIIRFRSKRIYFAEDFLGNELEGASDRFVPPKMMRELSEMTFHPGQLFGNVRAIGEEGNFSHQTLVLRGNGKTSFMNAFQKCGAIFFHDIGMQSADLFDLFAHRFQTMNQILGEMFAFALAHFD